MNSILESSIQHPLFIQNMLDSTFLIFDNWMSRSISSKIREIYANIFFLSMDSLSKTTKKEVFEYDTKSDKKTRNS